MRSHTIHKKDALIDTDKLKGVLESKEMGYKELHEWIVIQYGLDITYKGFMSLMYNHSTWKLLYAIAIADVLKVQITDIFKIVEIDINKKAIEIEEWKRKYQK